MSKIIMKDNIIKPTILFGWYGSAVISLIMLLLLIFIAETELEYLATLFAFCGFAGWAIQEYESVGLKRNSNIGNDY